MSITKISNTDERIVREVVEIAARAPLAGDAGWRLRLVRLVRLLHDRVTA